MENGICLMPCGMTMLRRVRVFATRDFPKGCGRHVPRINAEQTSNGDILRGIENGVDATEKHDRGKAPIEMPGSSVLTEKLEQEPMLENQAVVPYVLSGPSLVEEEQMGVKVPSTIDNGRIDEPKRVLENDASVSFMKTNHGDGASPKEVITKKLDLSTDIPLCGGLVTNKIRNYPPRRKVPAIRDFPPLCGRNAHFTLKIDGQNGSASPNEKVSKEKPVQENKLMKGKQKTDVERVDNSSKCQDARMDLDDVLKAVTNDIQAISEGDMVKKDEVGEYTETEMPQEDHIDDLARSPVGTRWASQSKAVIGESDAAGLDESTHEEIVGGHKRKISDVSQQGNIMQKDYVEISELLPKRVIVLGLTAASSSKLPKKGQRSVNSRKLKSASKKMKVEQKVLGESIPGKSLPPTEDAGEEGTLQLIILGNEDPIDSDGQPKEGASQLLPDNNKLGGGKEDLHSMGSKKSKSYFRKKKGEKKVLIEKVPEESSPAKADDDDETMRQLVVWEANDPDDLNGICQDLQVANKPKGMSVNVPPLRLAYFLNGNDEDHCINARNKVREILRLFQAVCRKLLQEEEAKLNDEVKHRRRVDLQAAKILKDKDRYINMGKQILGSVPGVEVGDEFQYRVELNIIGLHRQIQGGIDYVKQGNKILATSIVSSGAYADDLENSDFLIYTGQGGNVIGKDKEPEDQKLERGNLALKNSISAQNPVRVIRGLKETRPSESSDSKYKSSVIYIYDGLYLVEKYWQEEGPHGKQVFKFHLKRIPCQPELAWKQVKRSKNFETREGLCVKDISEGKEVIPISAVNTIDDEIPLPFTYITRMVYPDWCRPIPRMGCNCSRGCSDSQKCACAVQNGGEIPYNYNGAIVEIKPLVYECGPSCKCPPSCPNRVSQNGIKFQLEIFKTETRGWAVRSLDSIPSGSFICEYLGELLEDKEAEQRTNDEYLFDIGNNYNDSNLWEGLSTLMPDVQSNSCDHVENVGFTIDAAKYGNVGRFINHSCSPNLYAQDVLYDHDDNRIPHIMLFAAENIPPLQELTYHYNYKVDQVQNSDGSIRRKSCYCGAPDCTGRMY